ncbi:MAG: nucleotide exchange factor GrpE [Planctomycetota bacterium]|jgi:molecular chaperone GrpE
MMHRKKGKSKADDLQSADRNEHKEQENELKEKPDTIESLRVEKDELFAKLQRVSADYANFQKRMPKQITDSIAYEKERVIKTLLPALDNFEHTLQNAHSAEDVDVLVKGIRIIYDQLLDILKSHNVEQIEALGERFDPAMHQAMTQQSDPGKEENTVLEEFQKGYSLNGRVIRPSKVIVNKLPEEQQGNGQESKPPQQREDECEQKDTE